MAKTSGRKSDAARRANQVIRSRTMIMMLILGVVTFLLLFGKLYDLQIRQHDELQAKAIKQQTRSTVVTATRGTIFDRNGNRLALSATAETVFVSPKEIHDCKEEQDADYIARGLSRILEVEEAGIREKMEKTSSQYEIIKMRADQEAADEVRRFINGEIDDTGKVLVTENDAGKQVLISDPSSRPVKLRGVYLEPDSKRYYPYGTLASNVIGFVGTENSGLMGLEAKYDEVLQGTAGLTVTAKNAAGKDLLYQYEQYYDAENGNDLVLTLDTKVQYYLEKGMESMLTKYDAKNGGTGIVMDVNSGAILGMATYPNYDLQHPTQVYDPKLQAKLQGLEEGSDTYKKALGEAQQAQWRNKCIDSTYEPGSTFKPLTLAAVLEEGVVNMNSSFHCTGSIMVPGWSKPIGCSKRSGHGTQSLKEAVGHSCNPAFVTMALKLGSERYYPYLRSFGLMDVTGVDMIGETNGIFASEEDFNSNVVSLATYSFGQTFNVTPLALIRAQAACVNGGYLYTPYVVDQVLDDRGMILDSHEDITPVRQVISEETSAEVRECLEYVVSNGGGKNGQVAGYRIGGKTGTADKTGTRTASNPRGDVVVSFMCFAPADDPQVIMLLTMDTPSRNTGTPTFGGTMVAPTASRIMSEILPWLGISPDYTAENLTSVDATVPNVVGKSLEDAKEKLTGAGFQFKTVGEGAVVTDQTPVGGTIIPNNGSVILYLGAEKSQDLCKVPDVLGLSPEEVNSRLTNAGLILKVAGTAVSGSGNVKAISQSSPYGAEVEAGTVITVQFGDSTVLD